MTMDFTFSVGYGEMAEQAKFLTRSIKETNKDSEIFAFLIENEKDKIAEDTLSELESKTNIITGKMPNENYPMTSKIKAVLEAKKRTDNPVIMLDNDVLILDEIEMSFNDADVAVKPADLEATDWLLHDKITNVSEDIMGYPVSKNYKSTVDKRKIPPIFNAGVVAVANEDFPKEWLKLTEKVFKKKKARYSDQISLGILSKEFNYKVLSEMFNYPLCLRFYIPKNVKILHYHSYHYLLSFGANRKFLSKNGIWKEVTNLGNLLRFSETFFTKAFKRVIWKGLGERPIYYRIREQKSIK